MKKLAALITVTSLSIAAPVFACPGHDDSDAPATKTAEKTKDGKDAPATKDAPKQEAPKQDAPKTATTKAPSKAQPKKDTTKAAPKPTKVSQK